MSSLFSISDAKVEMSVPLTSTPLIAEMARAPGWMTPGVWYSKRTACRLKRARL
jgi:hypothetical protein